MKGFLIRWFVNIIALLAVTYIVPGISIDKWQTAILAALIIGFINISLRPLVIIFTLPFNILSLGFLTLIINGLMFYLASKLVSGFKITSFWYAFWGALFFSVVSFFLNLLVKPPVFFYNKHTYYRRKRDDDTIDI